MTRAFPVRQPPVGDGRGTASRPSVPTGLPGRCPRLDLKITATADTTPLRRSTAAYRSTAIRARVTVRCSGRGSQRSCVSLIDHAKALCWCTEIAIMFHWCRALNLMKRLRKRRRVQDAAFGYPHASAALQHIDSKNRQQYRRRIQRQPTRADTFLYPTAARLRGAPVSPDSSTLNRLLRS